MVSLPNIYEQRNLKFLIVVPLALMLIGLYFSTHIQLDSSLSGGVSITLATNSTIPPSQLASEISAQLNVASPTIQSSPGTVEVTIAANQSISNAYTYLLQVYSNDSLYNTYIVNASIARQALTSSPGNQTLISEYNVANAGLNSSLSGMRSALSSELATLAPLTKAAAYNSSSASAMVAIGQSAYSNAGTAYEQQIVSKLHNILPFTSYSYQEITVQQSQYFISQLRLIIVFAYILVSIVVFFIFRSIIPSIAVVFGAANDMIIALGAMGLFHIPLGIASIGGLLMLMGYSIDTDVLTSIRILKRHEGKPEDRAYGSMKTGLTMTITAIVSFGVLFVISLIAYVPTYYEISGVVLFGLIGDIATTWLGNASMILLYVKRKERIKG
jgi:preprotein translocase subunit SecF